MANLKEYRDARIQKLDRLRQLGIDPYPAKSSRDTANAKITTNYEEYTGKRVTIAGRVLSLRTHGKVAFIDVKDASGKIQLLVRADNVVRADRSNSELMFGELELLDIGDFVEASGQVTKTKLGEISVEVDHLRLLTKSIRPMPSAWDGLKDKETRLRRRYLDTNMNPEVHERFIRRSRFWEATRSFLNREGFTEINVPVLEHTTGGADAKPFKTYMDALDQDFYLRISHELPLKRLIGGGYERVFDIGPRFRNENYSDEHLPEHVAFESYAAYQDYEQAMQMYERMMKEVAQATWGKLKFKVGEFEVDLSRTWPVVRYPDIMRERFDVDVFKPDMKQLKQILAQHKVKLEGEVNELRAMDSVWKLIRREEAGPFWLIHEPVAISPLAKKDPVDQRVSQRFHPVIAGTEMGNGYSELNDPIDQLSRFLEQERLREAGDEEAQMLDIDFVEMLEYGMPPTTGWSYSERYFWALEGVSAREGVPFPQLRREVDDLTKSIYPEAYGARKEAASRRERPQDFSKRIVAVVNKDLEPWQVVNAVAHMAAIVGNETPKAQLVSGDFFVGRDQVTIPRNSQYAVIIMRASEKDLHKLYQKVREANLVHHVFIKEMQDSTDDAWIVKRLEKQAISETIFYGVSFLAENEEAEKLTKNFQLYK